MQSSRTIRRSSSLSQKSVSLLSSPRNLAHLLSEFANDDLPGIGEINCTSGILTESIRKSPSLPWAGEFESLKQFVAVSLKRKDVWSQPGGDKKVFALEDVSIIWRKIKSFCFSKEQEQTNSKWRFVDICAVIQVERLLLWRKLGSLNMGNYLMRKQLKYCRISVIRMLNL